MVSRRTSGRRSFSVQPADGRPLLLLRGIACSIHSGSVCEHRHSSLSRSATRVERPDSIVLDSGRVADTGVDVHVHVIAPAPFERSGRHPSTRVSAGEGGRHEVLNAVVVLRRHRDGLRAYEGRAQGRTSGQGAPDSVPAVRRGPKGEAAARGRPAGVRRSRRRRLGDSDRAAIRFPRCADFERSGAELSARGRTIGAARRRSASIPVTEGCPDGMAG